jgi:Xaa-Pro aminopeptidase
MARDNYMDMNFLCASTKREGLAAIVTGSPEGLFHTSGALIITHSPARDRLAFSIITADGHQALTVCQVEESLCAEDSWVEDVRTYIEFQELPTTLLAQALKGLGMSGKRVGIDLGYVRDKFFGELTTAAPSITFVEADALLMALYQRKPAALVQRMALAAQKTTAVVEGLLAESLVGQSERQVRVRAQNALARAGADGSYVVVATGPNILIPDHRATDRIIAGGNAVTIDASATYDGYVGEAAASIIVGSSDGTAEANLERVFFAAAKAMAGGTIGDAIFRAAEEAAGTIGGRLTSDSIGYGLSFGGREAPFIAGGSKGLLSIGMTISLDLGFCILNGQALRKKETWLIQEGHAVALAKFAVPGALTSLLSCSRGCYGSFASDP